MNRTLQGTVPSLWFGNARNVDYDPDADVIKISILWGYCMT